MTPPATSPGRASAGVLGKGRHDKLLLHGLFLPAPDSDLVLDGLTAGALLKGIGAETLWRGIRSLQADAASGRPAVPTSFVGQRLATMWAGAPPSPIRDQALAAIADQDWTRPPPPELTGLWHAFRNTFAGRLPDHWLARIDHYVEVEAACRDAARLLEAGDYRSAAECAARAPEISAYLGPGALALLAMCTDDAQALQARTIGFLEFTLSHIARVDVATSPAPSAEAEADDDIGALIGQRLDGRIVPGHSLVAACLRVLDVGSPAALLELDGRARPIDDSTLRRWSRGRTFPTPRSLSDFLDALVTERRDAAALRRRLDRVHWASQRLHVLLRLAREVALPHFMPGERATVDDWAAERYAHWRAHWLARGLPRCGHALVMTGD